MRPVALVRLHDKHLALAADEDVDGALRHVHQDPDVNVHELGLDGEEDGVASLERLYF